MTAKTSSISSTKEELLSSIRNSYAKICADYKLIPAESTRLISIEGNSKGTLISVCDTLAYLIGWGKLVIKWHAGKSMGNNVDFPETGYKWNQLGLLAESFYEDYKDRGYVDLLNEYDVVLNQILSIVQNSSNEELYENPWYEKWALGRMIQFNTSAPMKNMRTKIRRFIKSEGFK